MKEFASSEILAIDSPELARLYDLVYECKLSIYQASSEPNADINPSTFICSGGASLYFEQPIDVAVKEATSDIDLGGFFYSARGLLADVCVTLQAVILWNRGLGQLFFQYLRGLV